MKSPTQSRFAGVRTLQQRGVVLFFTLIALLAMSLAAVALIRSVDTSTLIAGNLSYNQSAADSANIGVDTAMAYLAQLSATTANDAATNPANLKNIDVPSQGYYSGGDPYRKLTDGSFINWTDADSVLVGGGPNASGNTVRYIIQRMCLTPNAATRFAGCMYGTPGDSLNSQSTRELANECVDNPSNPCPLAGQEPQTRVTVQTRGTRGNVTYIQAFVN